MHKIDFSTVSAIAIDTNDGIRDFLVQGLKSLGIKTAVGAANIKQAVEIMEVEKINLILCPTTTDKHNILHVLQLILAHSELHEVRVVLILKENEDKALISQAFSLGLLGTLRAADNHDTIFSELIEMSKVIKEYAGSTSKIASHYLYKWMMDNKMNSECVDFYMRWQDTEPGEKYWIENLAKVLQSGDRKEEALSVLKKGFILFGESEKFTEQAQTLTGTTKSFTEIMQEVSFAKSLNLQNCVVIDSDQNIITSVQKSAESLGFESVMTFTDSMAGWEWLEKNTPNFILHGWRMPKLSGPYLLQRIKHQFSSVPIVIMGDDFVEEDIHLLKEMGVSEVIKRNVSEEDFSKVIVKVAKKLESPQGVHELEEAILVAISSNHINKVKELWAKYKEITGISEANIITIESQVELACGNFERAKNLAIDVIKTYGGSLILLNTLAKCFIKLNQQAAALKCFSEAQKLSPMNIQRLCTVAEVLTQMGEGDQADAAILQAKSQDPGAEVIKESETKIAIVQGDTQKAKDMLGQLKYTHHVISYMNNCGVSYAKEGKYDEGFALYEKTLASIPESKKSLQAVVHYNFALACLRKGDSEQALAHLILAQNFKESNVHSKVEILLKKIESAKKKNIPIIMKDSQKNDEKFQSAELFIPPGSFCCYGIYKNKISLSDEIKKILENRLVFKMR